MLRACVLQRSCLQEMRMDLDHPCTSGPLLDFARIRARSRELLFRKRRRFLLGASASPSELGTETDFGYHWSASVGGWLVSCRTALLKVMPRISTLSRDCRKTRRIRSSCAKSPRSTGAWRSVDCPAD